MPAENSIPMMIAILPLYLGIINAGYDIKVYINLREIKNAIFYFILGIHNFYFFSGKSFLKRKSNIDLKDFDITKSIEATLMRHFKLESIEKLESSYKLNLINSCKNILNSFSSQNFAEMYGIFFTDHIYLPQDLMKKYIEKYYPKVNLFNYHVGHQNSTLIINQLSKKNKLRHPFSPPKNIFKKYIDNISYDESKILVEKIQNNLKSLYEKSLWYDRCNTSGYVKNQITTKEQLFKSNLSEEHVFAIFPHIYFDTPAFKGPDIYKNYRDWFESTIIFILENTDSKIIIKDHPANLSKYALDNAEFRSPVKFFLNSLDLKYDKRFLYLAPSTSISALNIIQIADCVLTVRGTIGLEASLLGKPVIFAGSGRFDGYGFGIFPNNISDYEELLLKFCLNKNQISFEEKLKAATYLDLLWHKMTHYSKIIFIDYPRNKKEKMISNVKTLNLKKIGHEIKPISKWIQKPDECCYTP
mgnify:CR=1 FL=1|tara:strand:+ start:301 stop:1716 length:1416 start_codon:yes stop_codon:yes gene_type:complete